MCFFRLYIDLKLMERQQNYTNFSNRNRCSGLKIENHQVLLLMRSSSLITKQYTP